VTDGAHYDNLGLWPLLQRRCRLILVSDASCDPSFDFADLLKAVRQARLEQGIEIEAVDGPAEVLPLDAVRPPKESYLSAANWFLARIRYPEGGATGTLIVIKASLTGKEPSDLLGHRRAYADFPHEPTGNQFFDEQQYESYRQLGEYIGTTVAPVLQEQLNLLHEIQFNAGPHADG
jgi:hypothetical protein